MKVERLALPEVVLVTPVVRGDARGAFHEAWRRDRYHEAGLPDRWVQDNVSRSRGGVLRGLHVQHPRPQGKLVSVLVGEILDVAVDVRRGSPTFGQWVSAVLTAAGAEQLYIPEGFAHGFAVTSDEAVVHYKCTDYYAPGGELTVLWNDPAIGITWPIDRPILSEKDAAARPLDRIAADELPGYSAPMARASS
jgi:dTDP-4-dehydrorhamnose 3,5-epimerase